MSARQLRPRGVLHGALEDERGTVLVEYVVVLTLVCLLCVPPTLVAAGLLLDRLHYQQALLLLPLP